MIHITYSEKKARLLVVTDNEHYELVSRIPNREFDKKARHWIVAPLQRNLEYIMSNIVGIATMSDEAKIEIHRRLPGSDSKIPAWYRYKNTPLAYQKETLEDVIPLNFYAIFFEQGLGKTYTSINAATIWRMQEKIQGVVVVCPASVKLVWETEILEHCPIPTQYHSLSKGKHTKAERFIREDNAFPWLIISVESLSSGRGHEILKAMLCKRACLFIIDESSRIKTPKRNRTDVCLNYGPLARKRLILSGTPMTKNLEDFYTQFTFLDSDILGHKTYYSFRSRYCVLQQVRVSEDKTITSIVDSQRVEEFIKLVSPYTARVDKAEALDLPEKIYQTKYVTMLGDQARLYREMEEDYYIEMDDTEFEAGSGLEQQMRLQQITGGFYPHDNGHDVELRPIPGKNPKVAELLSILEDVSGKIVIWFQFRSELDAVSSALKKAKIQYTQFHGGCDDLEKKFAVHSFRTEPDVRVFLASKAAAFGLTLIESCVAIYYSTGPFPEHYVQSQDRIHRFGQNDHCTYIHILMESTIDEKIAYEMNEKIANMARVDALLVRDRTARKKAARKRKLNVH